MAQTEAAGAIYDIGYRHYDGPRLGRPAAIRALYVQGLRSVFGLGRGVKAKIAPFVLLAFMIVPALIQAGLGGLVGPGLQIFTHERYFSTTAQLFGVFCAAQTPELVSGDQRSRVLALYFSRALRRSDYVLARVGALVSALFFVALLPHAILLFGRFFAAVDVSEAMRASLPVIWPILSSAAGIAALLGTVSLAIAALIPRRPFASAAILGAFLIANGFVAAIVQSAPEKLRYAALASPIVVGEGLSAWTFDTTSSDSTPPAVPAASTAPPAVAPAPPAAGVDVAPAAQGQQPGAGAGGRGGGPPQFGRGARGGRGQAQANLRQRRMRTTVQLADLGGLVYLTATLGYVLLASLALAVRYRGIEI